MRSRALFECGLWAVWCSSVAAQDAASLYREGLRLFAEGKSEAAAASLQQSLTIQPGNASAWKALGVAFASRGDYERAEPAFRNACERQPALADACLYYGRSLYLLDRFAPAIDVLRGALRDGDTIEGHRLLALSLEALGRSDEAEAEFVAALRVGGKTLPDEDPGIDYGVFLYRQGRTAQALGPLSAALERHPDSARGQLELGCVLLALERLEEAAQHLERSLALRDSRRAHQLLAKTYLRLGRPEAAEVHLKR